jgi:toxin ParE1/3/4
MRDKPNQFKLTPQAVADIEDIWRYTTSTWNLEQADTYVDEITHTLNVISQTPFIARERREFSPPVRIHPHKQHLIIYTIAHDHIAIIRILGTRQDWMSILRLIEN